MLRTLRIRNLVIIEDLSLEFGPGLNLLTGETGAGKSILVDAVGLAIGDRADRTLVRSGADRAVVEAAFEVGDLHAVREWASAAGLDDVVQDGQVIVRREIPAEGAGRVLVNGSPWTLAMLRELGERLLDLHGQHEYRSLLAPEHHLALLDQYGANDSAAAAVRETHDGVVAARGRLERLAAAAASRARRVAELQAIVRDLDALDPRPGELDALDRERRVLRNASRVAQLLERVIDEAYEGETTASALAARAGRYAAELAELDPSLADAAQRLRVAAVEIQDAAQTFVTYRDEADFRPDRFETVESRRVALERLYLRLGVEEQGIEAYRAAVATELADLDDLVGERRRALEAQASAEALYATTAAELTRLRRLAARKLAPAVQRQLGALAFDKAKFDVAFSDAAGERTLAGAVPLAPRGAERAEFLLAANPGEPLRPLNRVASGGELSRVMLALHAVVDGAGAGRALVFDEVDAGVGGAVADAVGKRLAGLATKHQVLCVTHLPQVAAYADRHFTVRKRVAAGRTHTEIDAVDGERRVDELARMLGGRVTTDVSRRHAAELLAAAGRANRGAGLRAGRKA